MRRWVKPLLWFGIAWLIFDILIISYTLFLLCPAVGCDGSSCCPRDGMFLFFLVLGIPSWILFLIILIFRGRVVREDRIKRKKRKKKR
jgi:hypothetical protein